jgi:hypothetical protein
MLHAVCGNHKYTAFGIRFGDSSNRPAPSICTFSIPVNEITQVNNVVDGVSSRRIAKSIEETKVIIRARINGKRDSTGLVARLWCGFGAANWAGVA